VKYPDMNIDGMVERRTYKTSLRAPASLVNGLAGLVVEREVLCYLHAVPGGEIDGFCLRKRGLERATAATRVLYHDSITSWKGCSPAAIEAALVTNAHAIASMKGRNPSFSTKAGLNRDDIAAVSGTAAPDPADISLHDYYLLASESLKMTCAHLDSIARQVIPLLPASSFLKPYAEIPKAVIDGSAALAGRTFVVLEKLSDSAKWYFLKPDYKTTTKR
jgi:hypothetical protein